MLDKLEKLAQEKLKKAEEFNRHPPKWAYWVFGIAVVILVQMVVVAMRN